MFKIKNLVALCCFWAITLAATAAWSAICFAPSGGCLEGEDIGIDDGSGDGGTRGPGSINSCPGFDLNHELTGPGYDGCESCIKKENGKETTYWRCKVHQCATKFNRVDKEGEPEEGYDCENCFTANDTLWHCVPHPCEDKYKLEKNDYHRDCSDTCVSARRTLYNCVCDNDHPLEVNGKCIKECTGYAEEYVEASDSCECQSGYTRRNGICSLENVSLSCEELLDKFSRVQYSKLSQSDCEANAKALGITQCIGQDDYWAGAVKACGGVTNMPTGDELFELAKCMYGKTEASSSMYGTRKDSYLQDLGLNTGDHVFVWQDYQSTKNKWSVVRMFAKDGSIPYWAERNGKNYYTGNGSYANNWENTSILSETLCHRPKSDLSCSELVKRFETKSYSAISQSTCNSEKGALGINNCPAGTDYWAGAVKTCGGIDKIASEDDLFKLAKCMYGKSQASSSMYGTRNDTYLSSLGLGTDSYVYAWSSYQNNKGDHNAVVRMFATDGSIPYWAERDGSKYYEGNGAYATDWKGNGIKSKVLCRKPAEEVKKISVQYASTSTCSPYLYMVDKKNQPDFNGFGTSAITKQINASEYEICLSLKTGTPSPIGTPAKLKIEGGSIGSVEIDATVPAADGGKCFGTKTFAYAEGTTYKITPICSTSDETPKKVSVYYAPTSTCAPYLYITKKGTSTPINFGTSSDQKTVDAGTYTVGFGLSKGSPTTIKIEGGNINQTVDATVSSGSSKVLGDFDFTENGVTYRITPDCSTPSNTNQYVTVLYDAPTDCNYALKLTNSSTGATTQIGAATQTIAAGTYQVKPTTSATQSFTIKMGRNGTPTTFYSSGGNYTFSTGVEYWITPTCGSSSSGGSSSTKVCYCYGTCCGTSTNNCISKCGGQGIASQCVRKDVSPNQICY